MPTSVCVCYSREIIIVMIQPAMRAHLASSEPLQPAGWLAGSLSAIQQVASVPVQFGSLELLLTSLREYR